MWLGQKDSQELQAAVWVPRELLRATLTCCVMSLLGSEYRHRLAHRQLAFERLTLLKGSTFSRAPTPPLISRVSIAEYLPAFVPPQPPVCLPWHHCPHVQPHAYIS